MNTPVLFSVHVASSFKKITPAEKQKLNKVGLVLPRINQSATVMFKITIFLGLYLILSARENCRND